MIALVRAVIRVAKSLGSRPNESSTSAKMGTARLITTAPAQARKDTAGTITNAAGALKKAGALDVVACCTHALLSGPAVDRIEASEISRFLVTDTVPLRRASSRIEVVSVAEVFADAISRIYTDASVSSLFVD